MSSQNPHISVDLEAEEQVLGALLVSEVAPQRVMASGLKPEDFYKSSNQMLFRVIMQEVAQGRASDEISIGAAAREAGVLNDVGGQNALHLLAANVDAPGNVVSHAEIIQKTGARRRIIKAGQSISAAASDPTRDIAEVRAEAIDELFPEQDGAVRRVGEVLTEVVEAIQNGGIDVLPTGFPALDSLLRGLAPGTLTLLAARPSSGKSVLALEIAKNAAAAGRPALFISLEMSEQELAMRMIASEARIPLSALLDGRLPGKRWDQIVTACNKIDQLPLWIYFRPKTDLVYVESLARTLIAGEGLDLLVIDYLQLLEGSDPRLTDFERVSQVSTGLKTMSGRLGLPVLAVSQLSRASEQRPDKTPRLSDLRSTGQLEQDADQVLLLHQKESDDDDDHRQLVISVAKNRNGPTGESELSFKPSMTSITSISYAA